MKKKKCFLILDCFAFVTEESCQPRFSCIWYTALAVPACGRACTRIPGFEINGNSVDIIEEIIAVETYETCEFYCTQEIEW